MALVRRADPRDLAVPGVADASRSASRGRLRRWLPIGIGLAMAVIMIVVAAAAPLFAPLSPSAQFADSVLKGPGAIERHLLGTDEFGRDILSRIIWGARVSLEVGLASVLFAFVFGVPLGIVAGVCGGRIEMLIMRCADTLMAFPTLLLALICAPLSPMSCCCCLVGAQWFRPGFRLLYHRALKRRFVRAAALRSSKE